MRIITTRKLRFYSKDRKKSFVTEGNNIIQEMSEEFTQDSMFRSARAAGVLQIISSEKIQKVMENDPDKNMPQNSHEQYLQPEVDEELVETEEDQEETEEERKARKKAERKARKAARKAAEESEEE